MNRILGAALGLGVAAASIALLKRGRFGNASGVLDTAPQDTQRKMEHMNADDMPLATGREDTHDVLGAEHSHPPTEAESLRASDRLVHGKVTSTEREAMYTDTKGVSTSGSQGNDLGQEDRNPIGHF